MAAKKAVKQAEPKGEASLELDGQKLELNIDDLTFGEVEFIEEYFNCALEDVDLESGRGIMILAFLSLQRTNPDITLDEIRDKKISLLKFNDGTEDDASPSTGKDS